MKYVLPSALFLSVLSLSALFGAAEKKPSDGESILIASFSAMLNISTVKVTPHEAFALKKEEIEPFTVFKKACAKNDLPTIQAMLLKKEIASKHAGMVVSDLGGNINDESLKAISSVYPYAVWDAQTPLLNRWPCFKEERIKHSLDHGFILPYQRFDPGFIISTLPILHYFLFSRKILQENPQRVLAEPDYTMIERLLHLGANPHFKGYYWPERNDVDAFYLAERAIKEEESEKLITLLNKYAKPADEKGEFNTTDMFYPGTVFYREEKKDDTKE